MTSSSRSRPNPYVSASASCRSTSASAPPVRRIVDRFYDLMDETPEYYVVRKLHPRELGGSRQKLFMFLSGWLGGPQLYVQQYGHPKLRARHLPFAIGNAERDAWIACMTQA